MSTDRSFKPWESGGGTHVLIPEFDLLAAESPVAIAAGLAVGRPNDDGEPPMWVVISSKPGGEVRALLEPAIDQYLAELPHGPGVDTISILCLNDGDRRSDALSDRRQGRNIRRDGTILVLAQEYWGGRNPADQDLSHLLMLHLGIEVAGQPRLQGLRRALLDPHVQSERDLDMWLAVVRPSSNRSPIFPQGYHFPATITA